MDEAIDVGHHFLDSGSFSLKKAAIAFAEETGNSEWDYYDTDDAFEYLDAYADFVLENECAIDLCANVDVIGNPKLSYRNLKYLEEKGLHPVPVIHFLDRRERTEPTHLSWLQKHIDEGYELIALGGLVGMHRKCTNWLDQCFDFVCGSGKHDPIVRLHGFGITSYPLMVRYPWWSVDSSSWTKIGAFGGILVPKLSKGKFDFTQDPYVMKVSDQSPDKSHRGKHYSTLPEASKRVINQWLHQINIDLEMVLTDCQTRRVANVLFFHEMEKGLPPYPWIFRIKPKSSLGLF